MTSMLNRRRFLSTAAATGFAGPALAQSATRVETPFRLLGNQPMTRLTIEGHGPYWFLLDTGAASFAVDDELARSLRLQRVGTGRSQGAVGRTRDIGIYRARDVVLAGSLRDRNVVMAGLPALRGQRFRGLFPMARGVAESGFDFDRRVFIIDTRPPAAHQGYDRVPVRIDATNGGVGHPSPRVQVQVDGREATLVLDTGSSGGIFLKPDFVRRHGLWAGATRYRDGMSQGAAGVFRTRTTTGRLQFGRYRFEGLPISLGHPDDHGRDGAGGYDGLLGMEVLRRTNFFLKPRRDELWIRPNRSIDDVYRFDRSGVDVEWKQNQVVVTFVSPGSPGDRAGLRVGDVITAATAADGTYDGLVWALTDAAGTEVQLTLVRDGGTPQDVTVTLDDGFNG